MFVSCLGLLLGSLRNARVRAHTHTHTHTHIHTYTHSYTHWHLHAHVHTNTGTNKHTETHTHTHTHTHEYRDWNVPLHCIYSKVVGPEQTFLLIQLTVWQTLWLYRRYHMSGWRLIKWNSELYSQLHLFLLEDTNVEEKNGTKGYACFPTAAFAEWNHQANRIDFCMKLQSGDRFSPICIVNLLCSRKFSSGI